MQDGFAPRTTARVLARGLLALVCALALLSVASGVDARRNVNRAAVRERQAAAARAFAGPRTRTTASTGVKHITFHNPKASGVLRSLRHHTCQADLKRRVLCRRD
jgi:hypothetical protein